MITFKQFMEAAVKTSDKPKFDSIKWPEIGDALREHCSDAMWMFKSPTATAIFRGDSKSAIEMINRKAAAKVDPSKTARRSQNTSNYYTEILDNHPNMQEFPKRSRSFICSTSQQTAGNFSSARHPENTLVLIPFNGTKIGVVGEIDLWIISISLFNTTTRNFEEMNNYFNELSIEDTWQALNEFDKELKQDNPESVKAFYRVFHNADPKKQDHRRFIEEIIKAYSPRKTGLKWYTTQNLPRKMSESEVWVSGPCIALSSAAFHRIKEIESRK